MRLILHADDLGASRAVNDSVFRLLEEGRITSASILANGPEFADAVRRARNFPSCSFRVHLNLTEFAPLTGVVCDSSARVFREWTLQIERVRRAGIEVTHLDSHHHVHTSWSLFPALKRLCREQGIQKVRLRHTFTTAGRVSRLRIGVHWCNARLRRHFTTTDEFGAFEAFTPNLFEKDRTVEVMLHPGHPRYLQETETFLRSELMGKYPCISYRELV